MVARTHRRNRKFFIDLLPLAFILWCPMTIVTVKKIYRKWIHDWRYGQSRKRSTLAIQLKTIRRDDGKKAAMNFREYLYLIGFYPKKGIDHGREKVNQAVR